MGIQGNRYQLNERIKELEYKLKKAKEENENLKKNRSITLKNIDLTGISKYEQLKKTKEELQELIGALAEDEYYSNVSDKDKKEIKDHIISEFWDVVQAHLGLLEKHGIKADEVMKGYPKHIKKLEKRGNKPRQKKCSKCIKKPNCCLYLGEHWTGEKEAESCRTYMEQEE